MTIDPGNMQGQPTDPPHDVTRLGGFGAISVRLAIEVGGIRLKLADVLNMAPGQVHVLDRRVDQPVDVLISERLVARGEIVSVGDKFGVRLTEVLPGNGL
ncbi:FliM/FliN family flagellar motor switch protein [Sandarakinorhabdus limnophila]|jgi:flagellar motor switch protein FliN/FliY|uniref:FliM/FliN family flagellar motor switch protein n=1 Tax=Sandarakinorhabdus limnophila TaxID=210512 RepID=UPI0026F2C853|nr:FliM/FliN family flagellar motor switch protein [Sandarakinorhabdus limnophila]MCM0032706.1 FliM/FliN family flagellar motor switch protein [Sandarakinorhabdus limnophila]